MDLSNREIAVLVWLAIFVGCVAISADCRRSFVDVLRVLFSPKIIQIISATTLWVAVCIWLLSALGVWVFDNLKVTLVWMVTFAFVAMFDVNRISESNTFFGKTARGIISITAVVTFIADSYSFSLIVELAIIPLLIFTTASHAILYSKPEYAKMEKMFGSLLALIGVTYIGFGLFQLASNISNFTTLHNLREFIIPSILSLLFLPYIYFLSAYITYEMQFAIVRHFMNDPTLYNYAMRKALFGFGLNLELLRRWSREIVRIRPTSRSSIEQSIKSMKDLKAREKNPPPVAATDGWSPYDAKEFLTGVGLATGYYQPSVDDWFASSPLIKLDDSFLSNNLAYYVAGDELLAKRLKLILNVNNHGESTLAEEHFWRVATVLVHAATGVSYDLIARLNASNTAYETVNHRCISIKKEQFSDGITCGYSIK